MKLFVNNHEGLLKAIKIECQRRHQAPLGLRLHGAFTGYSAQRDNPNRIDNAADERAESSPDDFVHLLMKRY